MEEKEYSPQGGGNVAGKKRYGWRFCACMPLNRKRETNGVKSDVKRGLKRGVAREIKVET